MKTRILLLTLITLALSNLLQAQQLMDATFGTDGKVITAVGPAASNLNSIAIQPDGKIVAAGFTDGNGRQFALARYQADGSLDNTFGDNGTVITSVGRASGAYAVALQRDGKIVAAGISFSNTLDFAAVRYNSDGSLDNSFGTNGVAIAMVGDGTDLARVMAIQSDGKIILAGVSNIGEVPNFGLARFNINGSLDKTFGTDGVLTTVFGSDSTDAYAIALQPDGKIVATGSCGTGLFAMARYQTDGTLDKSFDTDGKLTSAIGTGKGVVVQSDKKILISVAAPSKEFRLVRYLPNGTLDKTA